MSKNEKIERLQKKALKAVYRATYADKVGDIDRRDMQTYRVWHICEQIGALTGAVGIVEVAKIFAQFMG